MKVCGAYDGWESLQEGEDYSYAGMAVYDPQNPVPVSYTHLKI